MNTIRASGFDSAYTRAHTSTHRTLYNNKFHNNTSGYDKQWKNVFRLIRDTKTKIVIPNRWLDFDTSVLYVWTVLKKRAAADNMFRKQLL